MSRGKKAPRGAIVRIAPANKRDAKRKETFSARTRSNQAAVQPAIQARRGGRRYDDLCGRAAETNGPIFGRAYKVPGVITDACRLHRKVSLALALLDELEVKCFRRALASINPP
jgi:hypothetical protein